MGYSTKIHFRKDYIKKDGTCAIYLLVIINREKQYINLKMSWPADLCEDSQELLLPREKDDQEVDDYNVILRDNVARANEIFRGFRMARQGFTMESFMSYWENEFSRDSFTEYYESKLKWRLKMGDIGDITYKNHNSTLNWMKKFKKDVKFMDLNEKWAYKFDAFLAKKIKTRDGDTHNSRWGYHKNIKSMLKLARKQDHMRFTDPYEYFKCAPKRGTWGAVNDEQDLEKLVEYYFTTDHVSERFVLRRFLFSIATSLRISDLMRAERTWKQGSILKFVSKKGSRKKPKLNEIPLSSFALMLWKQAEAESNGARLFEQVTEQYSNRILRRIGLQLKIKTRLHHHVGRHSWTTNFLNNGGSIRAAQKILNHYDVRTTMKYDHMELKDILREAEKLEFISIPRTGE